MCPRITAVIDCLDFLWARLLWFTIRGGLSTCDTKSQQILCASSMKILQPSSRFIFSLKEDYYV